MFSKKSAPEERVESNPVSPVMTNTTPAPRSSSPSTLIGRDVTIKGDINATADLHIDGRIEGDITCAALIQGEASTIVGTITTETARLAGTINGSISARELTVLRTARIEGDVQYDALTIEQGAEVEGRFSHRTVAKPATNATAPAASGHAADSDDEPRLTLAN